MPDEWKRLLVDETYPISFDGVSLKPEGPHKGIIEFLCGLSQASPNNPFHQSMHEAFQAGREFSHEAGIYHFTPVDTIADFAEYKDDPNFIHEIASHSEPLWHASINGVWDGFTATFIRKSSIEKIIRLAQGERNIEGIRELTEDEWDLAYGWANTTGLLPSRVRHLERLANDPDALVKAWREDGLEYDRVHYQIHETASIELRRILKQLDDEGRV
jgi:hypothetical protein